MNDANHAQAVEAVETLIRHIEDIDGDLREGLERTPERAVSYTHLTLPTNREE